MNYSRLIKPALVFTVLLYIFSLWQRVPDVDDAWIGEHAYWLTKAGYVKSELMHGITNQELRHIVHHKFFTLNGYAAIKIYGFSLYTLKAVSLVWAIGFLFVFFRYVRRKFDHQAAIFSMLLMGFNAFIFQYSFVYRPEIVVMALGFVSFIFIEKFIDEDKKWYLLVAGFTAGVAASTHLNGFIYIGAGFLTLIWKKKYIPSLVMAVSVLPGIAIYFFDFTSQYNFDYWFYQINDSPALHKSSVMPSSVKYLLKILNEHMRFLHSPKEIIMTFLLAASVIFNFKDLKNKTIYLHYLLLLILLLSLISVHSTSKYLLLYIPVMMLIIITTAIKLWNRREDTTGYLSPENQKKIFTITLIAYLLVHTGFNIYLSTIKYDTRENAQITKKYFSEDTGDLVLIAPMEFIFNELPVYGRIQSDLSISEMQKFRNIKGTEYFNIADKLGVNAMMLSEEYVDKFGLKEYSEGDFMTRGYRISGKENGYLFLVKQDSD